MIGPAGVVYQDDLDLGKHRTAPAERTLKLLPLTAVRQELARPFTTVRKYMSYSTPTYSTTTSTSAPHSAAAAATTAAGTVRRAPYRRADPPRPFVSARITAMSMDGERVALAVRDPRGKCDYVLFWNVAWHYVTRLTRAMGPTCQPVHAPGGITNVAIAGSRAVWTVSYGKQTRVIAAVITDCQEWVVTRPTAGINRVAALAGDNSVLAYALAPAAGASRGLSSVGIVPATWGGVAVGEYPAPTLGLSVDDGRIASLGSDGTVSITTSSGEPLARVRVGQARAVALRGTVLAALTDRGTIDVYSVDSGRQVNSWSAPANATAIDVQYGIALVTAGRDVYATNLSTGLDRTCVPRAHQGSGADRSARRSHRVQRRRSGPHPVPADEPDRVEPDTTGR